MSDPRPSSDSKTESNPTPLSSANTNTTTNQNDILPLLTDTSLPYPAETKTATGVISGTPTTAILTSFSDKILLTLSQHGKLAQWFNVPLANDNPSIQDNPYLSLSVGPGTPQLHHEHDEYPSETEIEARDQDHAHDLAAAGLLIPQNRFAARPLLGGGGGSEREVWGGLLARCIAGLVAGKNAAESRVLIVGLGLVAVRIGGLAHEDADSDPDTDERKMLFLQVLELVSRVL